MTNLDSIFKSRDITLPKKVHLVKVMFFPVVTCPTLCDPIDGSPSGSTVPGILLARTLEWVAISFSIA